MNQNPVNGMQNSCNLKYEKGICGNFAADALVLFQMLKSVLFTYQ